MTVTRLASTAALGRFLFGYDSSVINGTVSAIGNKTLGLGLAYGIYAGYEPSQP